jgi:hypothetical protein
MTRSKKYRYPNGYDVEITFGQDKYCALVTTGFDPDFILNATDLDDMGLARFLERIRSLPLEKENRK